MISKPLDFYHHLQKNLSKAKLLVVGDVILDRYWFGDVQRISPEAPIPVLQVKSIEDKAGGAANVALGAARLGVFVTLLGCIGEDEAGSSLEALLKKEPNIRTFLLKDQRPTTLKLRMLAGHGQQLIRSDFEEKRAPSKEFEKAFEELIPQYDWVVFSDYNKGGLAHLKRLLSLCQKYQAKALVDPKELPIESYQGAYLLKPNGSEFKKMMGDFSNEKELFQKAQDAMARYDIQNILVTLSEKGMYLIEKDKPLWHIKALMHETYDVTGAGDTVIASLASVLCAGESKETAARIASLAASVSVSKIGTATCTLEEIQISAQNHQNEAQDVKIYNKESLFLEIKARKKMQQSIVMTNGCFDILHQGHLKILRDSKQLGDFLVVAINTDASIQTLKGKKRPIFPLKDRMLALEALSFVDAVIPFEDETPIKLIQGILPDVLVKGGDYLPKEIVGYKEVTENGGRVLSLPLLEGYSTTSLIERIKGNL